MRRARKEPHSESIAGHKIQQIPNCSNLKDGQKNAL